MSALPLLAVLDAIDALVIFVLATSVGFELIRRVPTLLHTPLMSGGNAICGIILVGAIVVAGTATTWIELSLAILAIGLATVNVVGGYAVTDRMLKMFRRKDEPAKPGAGPKAGPP